MSSAELSNTACSTVAGEENNTVEGATAVAVTDGVESNERANIVPNIVFHLFESTLSFNASILAVAQFTGPDIPTTILLNESEDFGDIEVSLGSLPAPSEHDSTTATSPTTAQPKN